MCTIGTHALAVPQHLLPDKDRRKKQAFQALKLYYAVEGLSLAEALEEGPGASHSRGQKWLA